jgi:hypothetical protein
MCSTKTGYSIWEEAAGPLLEEDEEGLEGAEWFDDDGSIGEGEEEDDDEDGGRGAMRGLPRYLRPPAPGSSFCLAEGLPQDALVTLAAFLAPAELMRLSLASKALAARARGAEGGAYPWLQKCLQVRAVPLSAAAAVVVVASVWWGPTRTHKTPLFACAWS